MKMGYISPLKEKRLSDSVIKVLVYLVKKKKITLAQGDQEYSIQHYQWKSVRSCKENFLKWYTKF